MKENDSPVQKIISEIGTLEKDIADFRRHIEKIKGAPREKSADIVGDDHQKLVSELEEIAELIETLPRKWQKDS